MGCGARLDRRCPSCNTQVPSEAHFCMNCGASLDEAPAARPVAEAPPEERRQVTVLFADLSGYTAFAERMDLLSHALNKAAETGLDEDRRSDMLFERIRQFFGQ